MAELFRIDDDHGCISLIDMNDVCHIVAYSTDVSLKVSWIIDIFFKNRELLRLHYNTDENAKHAMNLLHVRSVGEESDEEPSWVKELHNSAYSKAMDEERWASYGRRKD